MVILEVVRLNMVGQCWAFRKDVWRERQEFRCQRRQGHDGLHRHKYRDGIVEWDKDGIEKVRLI